MKKDILVPVLSLLVICLVASALLGGVNEVTAQKIEDLAAEKIVAAQQELIPAESYEEADADGSLYTLALDADGNTVGYIFTTSANGYGGAVKLMVGLDLNGAVAGLTVLELNETPGLGMKAKNANFLEQFIGVNGSVAYSKTATDAPNTVQAITSATITTKAVTAAVNKALSLYDTIKEANRNG